MKIKIASLMTAIGGLCALCCVVPIAGFLGLGALEAFFCDSLWAKGLGIGLMFIGIGYLGYKFWKKSCANTTTGSSCSIGCECKQI